MYLTLFFCFFLEGCSPKAHLEEVQTLGKKCGFESEKIQTHFYDLMMFIKLGDPHLIHIYLEGDGFAWFNKYEMAEDPTPDDPMGFRVACEDTSNATLIFLTRPCHYGLKRSCSYQDWTFERFSQKILNAYREVLDLLKTRYPHAVFHLYGYSGGAFLALLLGEKEPDITKITTFAGNLDHKVWTRFQGYTPLTGSLDIEDFEALSKIEQIHYIGENDLEIPVDVYQSYQNHFQKETHNLKFIFVKNFEHTSDWPLFWNEQQTY
ncbi:MAG: hypothetical protein JSS34_03965 [Proteobacteria bacterium]|nr:hypothetical protein [Pseudomonadota bacterium]